MDRRATPERLTREDGSPVRVLVVDDEPMLGDLLSTALRYEGWQVETALNGRTAIRSSTASLAVRKSTGMRGRASRRRRSTSSPDMSGSITSSTTTSGSRDVAVRTATSLDPDVVVLDVMLPDMSGLDVLRRLREARPRIPVLFLTARDAVED